jgi:hypothetical protein
MLRFSCECSDYSGDDCTNIRPVPVRYYIGESAAKQAKKAFIYRQYRYTILHRWSQQRRLFYLQRVDSDGSVWDFVRVDYWSETLLLIESFCCLPPAGFGFLPTNSGDTFVTAVPL